MKTLLRTGRGVGYKSKKAEDLLDSCSAAHDLIRAINEKRTNSKVRIGDTEVFLSTELIDTTEVNHEEAGQSSSRSRKIPSSSAED